LGAETRQFQRSNKAICQDASALELPISWRRIPLVSHLVVAAARTDGQRPQPRENKVMGYPDVSFLESNQKDDWKIDRLCLVISFWLVGSNTDLQVARKSRVLICRVRLKLVNFTSPWVNLHLLRGDEMMVGIGVLM
jgi:hypothetical protein